MFEIDEEYLNHLKHLKPPVKIEVIGVGGCGINAVNKMVRAKLNGVEFVAVDTDEQALSNSQAPSRIQITKNAEDFADKIFKVIEGTKLIIVVAGIGGKIGTSIAPVITQYSKNMGALTLAILTIPPGKKNADAEIKSLYYSADSVVKISCDKILQIGENISEEKASTIADNFLFQAVKSISDLINRPGIVNLQFEDVETVLKNSGSAFIGVGDARGENATLKAAQMALLCPLIENLRDATSVLISFMGSEKSFSMMEVNQASTLIQDAANNNAEIMWGMSINEDFGDMVRVTIIATRFGGAPSTNDNYSVRPPLYTPKDEAYYEKIDIPPWMR